MTALIVDDEPLARARLRRLLEAQGVGVPGEADNAADAIRLAEDLQPDLILLDIQMPVLTGMQTAAALLHLHNPPLVVFVTGYSDYAVEAFERDALDYLVKPVTPDRLAVTLARARERMAGRKARRAVRERVQKRFTETSPLQRLPIRTEFAVRLLPVQEILCVISRERRVFIQTADAEHRTYYTLKQLETLLPSDRFFRIHDSCLVNLESVQELLFLGDHAYEVRLSNGRLHPVARSRYADLQRRLGLNPHAES
jgi:DNA-binding LytR/AlgR family response regulator